MVIKNYIRIKKEKDFNNIILNIKPKFDYKIFYNSISK